MKLQKRLKVTEASVARTKAELETARGAAETVLRFVAAEVLDDPASLDANEILRSSSSSSRAGKDNEPQEKAPGAALREQLEFVWEKRKLEIFADEKASGDEREKETRAALERAVAARDASETRA
eukprot:CAMPEP_0185719330 /NCGR_PEP_ID=MMETSP1164-20130828/48519_1 /TAXON_ID=1104430 /ORGANISM="Chrysoreinhardia sp, Strain CCMP2950" /LENGTH=124 /DNA_ID=CAMNT_0028386989 /DNA_START=66 /DNA_END=436 /DNA_ORIENTATION=-